MIYYKNDQSKPLCQVCRLFPEICICDSVVKLNNNTRISLLIHIKELARLTNTGRLLALCLDNFSQEICGMPDNPLNANNLILPDHNNYILHPTASLTLDEVVKSATLPLNLIVPDGTWRQSNKMLRSSENLLKLPRVKLPATEKSAYHLRQERLPEHLSTFEAVARALGILEGAGIENEMLQLFNEFVKKLLNRSGRTSYLF